MGATATSVFCKFHISLALFSFLCKPKLGIRIPKVIPAVGEGSRGRGEELDVSVWLKSNSLSYFSGIELFHSHFVDQSLMEVWNLFNLAEIAYGLSVSTNVDCHCSTLSTIRADGSRRRRSSKDATLGKTSKGGELTIQSSPDSKSPLNQEEIISLFKRIQSSISKGDSTSSKKRSTKSSEGKPAIDLRSWKSFRIQGHNQKVQRQIRLLMASVRLIKEAKRNQKQTIHQHQIQNQHAHGQAL
ncbi:hypothetical protein HAX54_045561 [Datura stramonium]|uniref:Uncharacterized protein n=1 Tax=Datura stramonium TaxID=4076 RepID=A0ABS8WG29_DATST|nr:hypothetical protein [Datura stramonium]